MNLLKLSNLFFVLLISCSFFYCSNDNNDGTEIPAKEISIYMTDCPFDAEEVNVEIFNIKLEHDDGQFTYLSTTAGIYNFLDFQDGLDVIISSGLANISTLKNIYFELGNNNTIVIDGNTFPLKLEGGNEVKVKAALGNILKDMDLLIEFYACASIIENNGEYFLKPVIKFKGERKEGTGDELLNLTDLLEFFEDCYEIVYPIEIQDLDGTILTAANKVALNEILVNNDDLKLVYPVSLEALDGGAIVVVKEEKEFESLALDCFENNPASAMEQLLAKLKECYELVYPISFVDKDGITHTANDEMELTALFNQVDVEDVVFPADLLDDNGNTMTVDSYEQLLVLVLTCE